MKKDEHFKYSKGITLIALVVTIIVLIILAGVSINLVLGRNGIIQKSKDAEELSEEQTAKEKLEIELASLSINKETGAEYNDEIFDNYLTNKNFIVNGDIVLSDGWQFQVDKSVPKIIALLGRGEEISQVDLIANVEYLADYTKANLKIGITYEGNIVQIKVNGQEIEIPEKADGKYDISKEILENGNYNIYIKDENDGYKLMSVESTEISEDITITTVEELEEFRDRVNKGATYEGKTATLISNLDLSSVCGENIASWEPIGKATETPFKGTFDGNNNTISKLYINTTEFNRLGLFGVSNGTIKNVIVKEGSITTIRNSDRALIGGICSQNLNEGLIFNCINEGVTIYQKVNATLGAVSPTVGGICGQNNGTIEKCGNKATVEATTTTYETNVNVAGIVAINYGDIKQCYNKGIITAVSGRNTSVGGICSANESGNIKECYNIGKIIGDETKSGGLYMGGIVGLNRKTIDNCYSTGVVEKKSTTDFYKIGISLGYQNGSNVTRCYYLKGLGYSGYGGIDTSVSDSIKTVTPPKTDTELKALASILGEAFTDDTTNINAGYPILKWQVQE